MKQEKKNVSFLKKKLAKAKLESARVLKERNIDTEIIQEATGLSLSEIEKL